MWCQTALAVIGLVSMFIVPHAHAHPLEYKGQGIYENQKNLTEESYRLPQGIVPITYDLRLHTKLGKDDFSYQGLVSIALRVRNITDSITVHNDNLIINYNKTLVILKLGGSEKSLDIEHQQYDKERQFYIVKLKREISPGEYVLVLEFEGVILDDVFGFYRTSYQVNGRTRHMGVTQFSPTYARRAFPCMDEPHLKANFTLHVGHPNNQKVTSNTPVVQTSAYLNDTYVMTTFSPTPRMSTYLVGWTIHDFVSETLNVSENFRIWTRPSMNGRGSLSLKIGQSIYASLSSWLEMQNPIRKMDHFAVPDFNFNAMENWGMITFRESVALFETKSTPIKTIIKGLTTLAHEYAHTWFGNLATPEFWNVVWLKEGFASYFQYFGIALAKPNWPMMELFAVETLQPTLLSDSAKHNRTMNGQRVGNPSNIMGTLDFVSYRKGASVIQMLSHAMGTSAFQSGLRSYLRDMSYKAASPFDLYEHLQIAVDRSQNTRLNVKDFMESWTTQTGYPVVTVSPNCTSQEVLVSQDCFYENSSEIAEDNERSRWWIPLTILSRSSATNSMNVTAPIHWLSSRNRSLNIGPFHVNDWVIANVQQTGYYRVNYDQENWRKLIAYLRGRDFERINRVNRASLVDDVFNLARANYISYDVPFELSRYLIDEREYVPWVAAVNNLKFLNSMLSSLPGVYQDFKCYVTNLVGPLYKSLGFVETPHEHWITKLHRELILSASCSVNNAHCLRTSKTLFGAWIGGVDKTILKDIRSVVYCYGIQGGTEDDWNRTWDRLRSYTDLHTEQELLLNALGCTQNATLIDKYLDWSISIESNIRKQYRITAFNAVLEGSPGNVGAVLNFVRKYYRKIIDLTDYKFISKVFTAIGNKITTMEQLGQLQAFIGKNANHLGEALVAAEQAVLSGRGNVEWIRKHTPGVTRWLREQENLCD